MYVLRGLLDFQFPFNLWFAIGFMTVYGIVIALFKDLPDMEGDSKQDVRTLSVRLGVCVKFASKFILISSRIVSVISFCLLFLFLQPSFVFTLCLSLLSTAYAR